MLKYYIGKLYESMDDKWNILLSDQAVWWLLSGMCSAVCDRHYHHNSDSHEPAANAERVRLHKDDTDLHLFPCTSWINTTCKVYFRQYVIWLYADNINKTMDNQSQLIFDRQQFMWRYIIRCTTYVYIKFEQFYEE